MWWPTGTCWKKKAMARQVPTASHAQAALAIERRELSERARATIGSVLDRHPDRAGGGVGQASDRAPLLQRGLDEADGLGGQPLAREHVGDPRGIGRE